jgi:nucleoid DNA-binding protein
VARTQRIRGTRRDEITKPAVFPLRSAKSGCYSFSPSKPPWGAPRCRPEKSSGCVARKFVDRSRQEEAEMSAKRLTKAQVIAEIAESAELDKKSVSRVFDGLTELIKKELRKPNGEFVIPGLLKLRAIKKPATKDRPGINPFTKQPIIIKGKPAQKKVRATALKALKDLIQ